MNESSRRGSHSLADRELLIRNVLEAMGTRRDIISGRRRNTELEQLLRDATHVGSVMIQETSSPASLPGGGGGAPAHGRPGGQWSVFLLWIIWTLGEPIYTIGQIFPV